MSIEAHHLQTWIGAEVLDRAGEKLGKLEDVYFRDAEPLVVTIRSGLAGRKHHAAALAGAAVTRADLQLDATADMLVAAGSNGLDATGLSALGEHEPRLSALLIGDLESWTAREQRLRAQAEAAAAAEKLDVEAQHRLEEEDAAKKKARAAEHDAAAARRAREDAEEQAEQARREAEPAH
jgi:hypothetical protein